jgi:hypothetical protein
MTTPIIPLSVEELPDWSIQEIEGVNLGDKRLNQRAAETLVKLGKHPRGSIPQGCDEWADTKATYELFKNEKVTAEKLRQPHQERTWERVGQHKCVLAVQDTSYLDYTHFKKMAGLGPIGTKEQNLRGIVMHHTLAVTPDGVPLGNLHQMLWVRSDEEQQLTAAEKKDRPIEKKESYKWLESLQAIDEHCPLDTQVVSVCDAESDVYELLVAAKKLEAAYLIRAAQDRRVLEPEVGTIKASVSSRRAKAYLTIEVSAKKNEPKRQATVSVRHRKVKLKAPYRPLRPGYEPLPALVVDAILVREDSPPDGMTPVEWLLLTNVPVKTVEDALARIAWYCQRWQIEIFFKILKSGCRIEHRRLKNFARLQPCIALFSMIAWRIHWLTNVQRIDPTLPCTIVLADHEWRALYALATRLATEPSEVPTVEQAVIWIAQLGGFLNRKGDGYPGVTVIWRGWQRFQDALSMWLVFNPPKKLMGKT